MSEITRKKPYKKSSKISDKILISNQRNYGTKSNFAYWWFRTL